MVKDKSKYKNNTNLKISSLKLYNVTECIKTVLKD